MKKAFLFLALVAIILTPLLVFATHEGGVVPCGGEGHPDCTLCHLFQLSNNIINWVLLTFIPIIAPIFLVIGGLYLLVARDNPQTLSTGKNILTAVVVGLIIVYAAWVVLNTVMAFAGVATWTGLGDWWVIECPTP